MDSPGTNSNPAGSEFGENLSWGHRTIHLMKLMASTTLPAAIKRQYSSVLPLSCHSLPVFNKICGTAITFVSLLSEIPLDRSALLVLSITRWAGQSPT